MGAIHALRAPMSIRRSMGMTVTIAGDRWNRLCSEKIHIEAITDIPHRLNEIWLAGINLDFLAQRKDMCVHRAVVIDFIGPCLLQQFRPTEG